MTNLETALTVCWLVLPLTVAIQLKVIRWQTVLRVLALVSLVCGYVLVLLKLTVLK
jgi:hypothetical protein